MDSEGLVVMLDMAGHTIRDLHATLAQANARATEQEATIAHLREELREARPTS